MSDTPIANRDALLGSLGKRRYESVTTQGVTYRLRSLFEREFASLTAERAESSADVMARRRQLLALCLVDDVGNPLLTVEEADRLGDIDQEAARALYDACDRLTGLVPPKN